MRCIISVCLIVFFLHGKLYAQEILKGKIYNNEGKPLSGVQIFVQDNLATRTDSVGSFVVNVPALPVTLKLIKTGFVRQFIQVSSNEELLLTLNPVAQLLDTARVQAFGMDRSVFTTDATVSVISEETFKRFDGRAILNAVNTIPGVKMDERSPGSYRLSIRGNLLRAAFGVRNVKIYLDGLPLSDASGNTYLNAIPPDFISGAEVIRGLSGSMYGASTGGVMLLDGPKFSTGKNEVSAGLSTGNLGYRSASFQIKKAGKLSTVLSATHTRQNGYRQQSAMERNAIFSKNKFQVSSRQFLTANVVYSNLFYETPGGLTIAQAMKDGKQARPAAGSFPSAAAQKAAIYLQYIQYSLSHEIEFSSSWKNNTGLYGTYNALKNPSIRNYEDKYERGFGGRTVFTNNYHSISTVFGAEYQHSFIHTGTFNNLLGNKGNLQYLDEIKAKRQGLFAQTNYSIGGFSATAGLSYNTYRYDFDRLSDSIRNKEVLKFNAELVPRIALAYRMKTINFYTSLGTGFSPPSLDEVHASDGRFNIGLQAERAFGLEAGFKLLSRNGNWSGGIAYYNTRLRKTIVVLRDSSGAEYYVNAGKTRQRGVETEIKYRWRNSDSSFIRNLELFFNGSINDARFLTYSRENKDFSGNKLTGTPVSNFSFGFVSTFPCRLQLSSICTITGKIPLNDGNTVFAPSNQLLQSKLSYLFTRSSYHAELSFAQTQSFNNFYSLGFDLNAAGSRFYNPSAPSAFTIALRLSYSY